MISLDDLVERCTFPRRPAAVHCAYSGGADSTALVALAAHAGLSVVAHHVDHRLRPESAAEAATAARHAQALGVTFELYEVVVPPGPNLEARARYARRSALPDGVMTGHTADDQAETVLLRLLRGSGGRGLSAIEPGPTHPILALRRSETAAVCAWLGISPVHDASNDERTSWRNRVRHEVVPLLADIAERDVVPIISRTADLLRDDADLLDALAAEVDPTDAAAIAALAPALARHSLRRWLSEHGYPPDAAAIDRVIDVANGRSIACELPGGRRVERSHQRLRIVDR